MEQEKANTGRNGAPKQRVDWRSGKPMLCRDAAFWLEHGRLRLQSGLSMPRYCKANGLALSTYRHGNKAHYRSVQRIGEDLVETLEYTPTRLEVLQHARLKYRCEDVHSATTIRTAGAQPSPIAKCNAGAGLLAQVLVAKYADHMPLARQERIFARHGASISRQTLCDWALPSAELLRPLMAPLHQHVLACPVIFADDTKLALHPGHGSGRGKTITARLWAYVGGGAQRDEHGHWTAVAPAALYDFTCSRAGEHPRRILQGWSGYLQADDFSGHQALFRSGAITHAACWAHVRRRYEAIVKTAPKGSPPSLAHQALRFIGELYRVEHETARANPDERHCQRQQRTRPVLDDMLRWLQKHAPTVLPKSPLGQAFTYTLSNRTALTVFLDQGMLLADNNSCERAMRPVAVSNWLFAGSERGGHAAAVAFSLIETAKLNAIEPYTYLKDVLSRINRPPLRPVGRTGSDTAHAQPAPEAPPVVRPGRGDFRVGDKVAFEDRYLNTQVGTVVRINQHTATVDTGGGHSWRVSFALLRQVIDVS